MTGRIGHDGTIAREVRDEMEAHVAARVEDNLRKGMAMADAEREARARFGAQPRLERESTRIRSRGRRPWRWIGPDAREAWHRLSRRPMAAMCALIVAAVGLTTTLAAARVVNALVVSPPAGVREPANIFSVLDSVRDNQPGFLAYPAFEAIARALPDTGMFAWDRRTLQIAHGRDVRVWTTTIATGAYFPDALGVSAEVGRVLDRGDDEHARPVAVVSHRLAITLGAAPADVLGTTLRINGASFEVVGVAGKNFRGLESGMPSDVWLPMSSEPAISNPTVFPDGHSVSGFRNSPDIGWLRLGMRRSAGTSVTDAANRITAVLLGPGVPQYDAYRNRHALVNERIWLPPFSGDMDRLTSVMRIIFSAGLLTLLLTAACLGSIFVGRQSDRAREASLRLALGASPARLLRLAALEVFLVVSAGAAVSLLLSSLVLTAAGKLQLVSGVIVSDAAGATLDARALITTAAMAAIVGVLASIGPLILVAKFTRNSYVESSRVTTPGTQLRRLLLIAQVAAGCAFLCGATLLTRSISALRGQTLGYNASATAFVELDPAGAGIKGTDLTSVTTKLTQAATDGTLIAFADQAPYLGGGTLFFVAQASTITQQIAMPTTRVSAAYFETLGIPIVAGRAFTDSDAGRPVVVVSEPTAKWYWPGKPAVGQMLRMGGPNGRMVEVVGVAAGIRDAGLKGNLGNRIYVPFTSDAESLMLFARRPGASAADVVPSLAAIATGADARLFVLRTGTLIELAWRTIEQRVLIRFVVVTIGIGALLMIATGVWGLSHSTLRRRWREFGIRQALGGTRGHIARLALGDALVVCAIGTGAGLAASWQIGLLLQSWLFSVTAHDPWSMAASAGVVAVAALTGAMLPARQAGQLDPSILLRDE